MPGLGYYRVARREKGQAGPEAEGPCLTLLLWGVCRNPGEGPAFLRAWAFTPVLHLPGMGDAAGPG